MKKVLKKTKNALKELNNIKNKHKNHLLLQMANAILENEDEIISLNKIDLENAKKANISSHLYNELLLDSKKIKQMAQSLENLAYQNDLVEKKMDSWVLKNGLSVKKVRVPIGVIAIIYENRPNITGNAVGLCIKSGNVVVLDGGKNAINTNKIIVKILQDVLVRNSLPKEIISFLDLSKEELINLLQFDNYIDLVIPRGDEKLAKLISKNSIIPVMKYDIGLCHLYVDEDAKQNRAIKLAINSKCKESTVCNAIETLLVHKKISKEFLPKIKEAFDKKGTIVKGCKKTCKIIDAKIVDDVDWDKEYLDNIINIKVVKSMKNAIKHIRKHGTKHSEAIVTENPKTAEYFLKKVDASCVYLNASTLFTDGEILGFGTDIGIGTSKFLARGPIGAEALTAYKYKIYGSGQIR